MKKDKLDIMLEMQKDLQEKINKEKFGNLEFNQEYINHMTVALTDEIFEALRETPFKYWKKNQVLNKDNFQKELIDAWHFFMNLLIAGGITADKLYEMYCEKNKINYERVKNNY
jgi:dimeric dUTPase (all-alpha-NTP-PPase superfamily)